MVGLEVEMNTIYAFCSLFFLSQLVKMRPAAGVWRVDALL